MDFLPIFAKLWQLWVFCALICGKSMIEVLIIYRVLQLWWVVMVKKSIYKSFGIKNMIFSKKGNFPNFDQNSVFWSKFRILSEIPYFDGNTEFSRKFRTLREIPNFDENSNFWRKFLLVKNESVFIELLKICKIVKFLE